MWTCSEGRWKKRQGSLTWNHLFRIYYWMDWMYMELFAFKHSVLQHSVPLLRSASGCPLLCGHHGPQNPTSNKMEETHLTVSDRYDMFWLWHTMTTYLTFSEPLLLDCCCGSQSACAMNSSVEFGSSSASSSLTDQHFMTPFKFLANHLS